MSPIGEYPDAPQGRRTLMEGQRYQEFVRQILNPWGITMWHEEGMLFQYAVGENRQGCEIKLDSLCTSTCRLSIEVAEKVRRTDPAWVPSGIMRADNAWLYVQGNYEKIFVFSKKWLRRWCEEKVEPGDIHESNGTVRKFYLPIILAMPAACLVLDGHGKRLCGNGDGSGLIHS